MFSEQSIEVAHTFYRARKAMKFLDEEKYPQRVANTKPVIEKVMAAHKCDVIPAVQFCIEQIVEKFPYDNGLQVAMLLATAVEMIEGTPNNTFVCDHQGGAASEDPASHCPGGPTT